MDYFEWVLFIMGNPMVNLEQFFPNDSLKMVRITKELIGVVNFTSSYSKVTEQEHTDTLAIALIINFIKTEITGNSVKEAINI